MLCVRPQPTNPSILWFDDIPASTWLGPTIPRIPHSGSATGEEVMGALAAVKSAPWFFARISGNARNVGLSGGV